MSSKRVLAREGQSNRQRPWLHQGLITGLTADGRSEEYAAGRHWYR